MHHMRSKTMIAACIGRDIFPEGPGFLSHVIKEIDGFPKKLCSEVVLRQEFQTQIITYKRIRKMNIGIRIVAFAFGTELFGQLVP